MHRSDEPHAVVHAGLAIEPTATELAAWAVAHAALAPSEHNSQPWAFRRHESPAGELRLDLLLDAGRAVPVVDPDRREAVLACGAALLNLRLALEAAGCYVDVRSSPEASQPELLARVRAVQVGPRADTPLRAAIPLRGTHRGHFEATDVPGDLLVALQDEAAAEGVAVAVLSGFERALWKRLTAAATSRLAGNRAYQREAATWGRTNGSARVDGVPGYAVGRSDLRSFLQPVLGRTAHSPLQRRTAPSDAAADAPAVLVVWTPDDDVRSVLAAGAAMQRVLLRARSEHLAASFVNASLQVPDLRRTFAHRTGLSCPQVVLRIGYGELVRPTPRRNVTDVLTPVPPGIEEAASCPASKS